MRFMSIFGFPFAWFFVSVVSVVSAPAVVERVERLAHIVVRLVHLRRSRSVEPHRKAGEAVGRLAELHRLRGHLLPHLEAKHVEVAGVESARKARRILLDGFGILLDFLNKIFYNRNKKGGSTYGHS